MSGSSSTSYMLLKVAFDQVPFLTSFYLTRSAWKKWETLLCLGQIHMPPWRSTRPKSPWLLLCIPFCQQSLHHFTVWIYFFINFADDLNLFAPIHICSATFLQWFSCWCTVHCLSLCFPKDSALACSRSRHPAYYSCNLGENGAKRVPSI